MKTLIQQYKESGRVTEPIFHKILAEIGSTDIPVTVHEEIVGIPIGELQWDWDGSQWIENFIDTGYKAFFKCSIANSGVHYNLYWNLEYYDVPHDYDPSIQPQQLDPNANLFPPSLFPEIELYQGSSLTDIGLVFLNAKTPPLTHDWGVFFYEVDANGLRLLVMDTIPFNDFDGEEQHFNVKISGAQYLMLSEPPLL